MKDMIKHISNKPAVMTTLKKWRPALVSLFQAVVQVSTEVQPQTGTKTINFTNEVILDLPPRMRHQMLSEFTGWLNMKGRDFLEPEDFQSVSIQLEARLLRERIQVCLVDEETGYNIVEILDYADLAPFLQAGLDYHKRANTFFVPRS
ncbi:hypothetical protein pEaSNUABM8_00208 [Erwinia phage pEa_SNUABM_8]|nr:hypothetical protein pEaSNUABM8_00208 [Erwinia phage pEa_SNUABM_8]QVW54960.1 hypothetical protein pEaSNUABM4_00207 [Erwinia phage pEa_SNUABM_4]